LEQRRAILVVSLRTIFSSLLACGSVTLSTISYKSLRIFLQSLPERAKVFKSLDEGYKAILLYFYWVLIALKTTSELSRLSLVFTHPLSIFFLVKALS
jgi:hypothetical protein